MAEDGAFSHKKVAPIFLNRLILPIGGASAVKGLRLQPAQQACSSSSMLFFSIFLFTK